MMQNRLSKLGLAIVLAGVGLALVQFRVQAAQVPVRAVDDLDSFTDAQLERDLIDELDDIFGTDSPDGQVPLDELQEEILAALGDEGDEGFESEIDQEELDEEMEEAETTLAEVVEEALVRADGIASMEASPFTTFARNEPSDSPVFRFQNASLSLSIQNRNQRGFSTSRVAIRETARGTIAAIRRVRR